MKKLLILLYLILLSVFDCRERKIPVVLIVFGALAAVGSRFLEGADARSGVKWTVVSVCLGMLPGLFMTAAALLTRKMGCGDGLILMNMGVLLGYRTCLLLLSFSVFLAALFSIGLLAARRADRHTRLPYLPFLAAAYLAGMLI